MACAAVHYDDLIVVLPRGITVPAGVECHTLPNWLAGSSRVSKLRPILWLIYASLLFPTNRSRRVLSTTHQVLPFRKHQIVTVHDLRPYFEPDTWTQRVYFRFMLPRALRRCDGILTVSQTSKQQISSIFCIDKAIIHVVPNAIDLPNLGAAHNQSKLDERKYLLMVGASWKHKNAMEVLDQYELWRPYFRLKIVAAASQYRDQLKARIGVLGIGDSVDLLEGITDDRLTALYRDCSALIYPSTMEGFGLPPLEAMAWSKPTIVSDIPVFRELLGDLPLYVTLGSKASWKLAIDSLVKEITIGAPDRMRARSTHAASYSHDQMCLAFTRAIEAIWKLKPRTAV